MDDPSNVNNSVLSCFNSSITNAVSTSSSVLGAPILRTEATSAAIPLASSPPPCHDVHVPAGGGASSLGAVLYPYRESIGISQLIVPHDPHNQAPASSTFPGADFNHVTGQASHLVQPVRGSDDSSPRTEQLLRQLGEDSPPGLEPFDQSARVSNESSTRTEPLCHHDSRNQAPAGSTFPGADFNHVTG